MLENDLRRLIRQILVEDYVPAHKQKMFYTALSNGIKAGRGEKIDDPKNKRGENYLETYKDNNNIETFLRIYKEILPKTSYAEKFSSDTEVKSHSPVSGMLKRMYKYLNNKSYEEELLKFVKESKYIDKVKKSYDGLTNAYLKAQVKDCYLAFDNFLGDINANIHNDFDWVSSLS